MQPWSSLAKGLFRVTIISILITNILLFSDVLEYVSTED